MADTVVPTDPVKPEALENNAPAAATPASPVVNATDPAEVERLKKDAEQARMRANQLENELAARKKADEEAEAERLKKNEEYQTLYEQERTKREEVERKQEAEERAKVVTEAKQKALADYPDAVKKLAETTGLDLADTSDEAVTAFKSKLDDIQTQIGVPKVGANNPSVSSAKAPQLTGADFEAMMKDPAKRDAYYRAKGGLTAEMMSPQQ